MHLVLSQEQRLIGESAARIFGASGRGKSAPGGTLWTELATGGWLEMLADPAADGVDIAVFFMEAGRTGSTAPLLEGALMAGRQLARSDRPELADLVSAARTFAFASEPLSGAPPPQAERDGDGWRLTGGWLSPEGGHSARFLVPAGDAVFVLDAGMPDLTVELHDGMDGGRAASLHAAGLSVAETQRLDVPAAAMGEIRAAAAAASCAAAAGAIAFLVEATRDYASQRRQFGRPIASFQTIEHRLARMLIAAEEAKALAMLAAIRLRAETATRNRSISVAKSRIGALSRFVAQNAVQTHGGMGVSEEMPIGHHFRRLMAFEARLGSTRQHRAAIADFVRGAEDLGRALIDAA